MELFPAIDLKDGQVVRLTQGDFDRVKVYAPDPAAVAERFRKQGARNLHVVDLDGARDGKVKNHETIRKIVEENGLFVQVGGGIRDEERVSAYLELGVGRVILGTIAVEDFSFLERMVAKYGEKIAVGVDTRNGKVSVRGWKEDSGLDGMAFCKRLEEAGVRTIIYTDISRDGLLQGINLGAFRTLTATLSCDIIASGGVTSLEDIVWLREMNLYGAIIGKALYEGNLSLSELVKVC